MKMTVGRFLGNDSTILIGSNTHELVALSFIYYRMDFIRYFIIDFLAIDTNKSVSRTNINN